MPQVMKSQARKVSPGQKSMPCVCQRLGLDRLPILTSTDETVIVKPDAEPQQLLSLLRAPSAKLRHDPSRQCDFAATTRFGGLDPHPEARLLEALNYSDLCPVQINVTPAQRSDLAPPKPQHPGEKHRHENAKRPRTLQGLRHSGNIPDFQRAPLDARRVNVIAWVAR